VILQKRKERLDLVPYEFANYENELQLSEGLSDYIEKRARDQHPHAVMDITDDIAPAGVRDLGYVEGRWMAMILDRFIFMAGNESGNLRIRNYPLKKMAFPFS